MIGMMGQENGLRVRIVGELKQRIRLKPFRSGGSILITFHAGSINDTSRGEGNKRQQVVVTLIGH